MNAVIIAAGKGTRLRPLTYTTPKPLIEVFGKPLIERNIDYLREIGITDITVVVGYKKEKFEFLAKKYPGLKLIYNDKYDEYNNIYSFYLVGDIVGDTYILEGDIYLNENVFKKDIKESAYFAKKPDYQNDEWQLITENGKLKEVKIGGANNYIMSGISFWNKKDCAKLKELVEKYIHDKAKLKEWYWDHIVKENPEEFKVGIEPLKKESIYEIDSLEELIELDASYKYILTNTKIKTAVILAAGKSREYDKPNGLIEIDDQVLIERNIDLLIKYGIKKIVLVTGYKKEMYSYLQNKYGSVVIVENDDYAKSGSFKSLLKAKNQIDGDILLLDSDIVYEERALKNILKNEEENIVLVSYEKGQKDESFVEAQNGKLYRISKDVRELKNVQGEMLGIAKLSYNLVKKILELKVENPMYAYEYAISECAKDFDISILKIDSLVWGEIDCIEHFNYINKYLLPRLRKIELDDSLHELRKILSKNLKIDEREVTDIEALGGMTNKNYLMTISGDKYVVRNPGIGTQEMVSRKSEAENAKIMSDLKIDADLIFYNPVTGFKVSRFVENAQTLNPVTVVKSLKDVAEILRKLHTSGVEFNNSFDCFEEMERYENLCKKLSLNFYDDYENVKAQVMNLKDKLGKLGIKMCSCHNDTVPENFVRNEERVYLVDWEYSGMNDPMWDLAALSIESNLSKEDEETFFTSYFNGDVDKESRLRIEIYKICQDFLWSIWTILKEASGSNFGDYGINRFNNAKLQLQRLDRYE